MRFKDSEGNYNSDFINVAAWRKQAEFIAAAFTKGRPICIFGSLRQRSWPNKDGQIHSVMEVTVDDVSFVDSNANNTLPDVDKM